MAQTGKESGCNAGDLGSIAGLGRSPEGGHGHFCSFLENPDGQDHGWLESVASQGGGHD